VNITGNLNMELPLRKSSVNARIDNGSLTVGGVLTSASTTADAGRWWM